MPVLIDRQEIGFSSIADAKKAVALAINSGDSVVALANRPGRLNFSRSQLDCLKGSGIFAYPLDADGKPILSQPLNLDA